MREFDTGATRDTDEGKLAYEGFLSPRVLERYAKYMHTHRVQADGKLRAADNWQKGIPIKAYMDSLVRHVMDVWLDWREDDRLDEDLLCAVLFNAMGLLFESTGAPIDVQFEHRDAGHIPDPRVGPPDRRRNNPVGNGRSGAVRRKNAWTAPHPFGRRSTDHAHP